MCGRCIEDTWFRLQGVCYTETEPFNKTRKAFENTGLSLRREKASLTCPESGNSAVPATTKITKSPYNKDFRAKESSALAHCKTFIPQFESGWHLHDTARKSERVSVFFVVFGMVMRTE